MARFAFLLFALIVCVVAPAVLIAQGQGEAGPTALMPGPKQVKGWALSGEVRVFEPENLFEYINGAAETYLDYGFVELATAEFRPEDGRKLSVTLDIYDMGAINHAFGIYSNGAFADANYIELGTEGYLTESSADFFKDRYYVKATGYGKPKDVQGPALALAKAVAANIKALPKPPSGLALLPEENRMPHTLKYFRGNALGQSFLKDAFQATYKIGNVEEGEEPQLLVANLQTADLAAAALQRFKKFMAEAGGKVLSEEAGSLVAEDPYYKRVSVKIHGRYFLCVLRAPEGEATAKLLDGAIGKLAGQP